ncbi:MAG: DUF465 domain-containing protein [Proteobacteria bacterium]|nr:DUF465 domain-containing protein [Pseudomonadota bacterium]
MKESETKEDIYKRARDQHTTLDRRLLMLLRKPYLTAQEELEIKVLKKKKLFLKDVMERMKEVINKEEK